MSERELVPGKQSAGVGRPRGVAPTRPGWNGNGRPSLPWRLNPEASSGRRFAPYRGGTLLACVFFLFLGDKENIFI